MDPVTGYIATSGNLGLVQMFDLDTAVVKDTVKVVNFLRVSRKDSVKNLFVPTITHHKFDPDGQILITVDVRKSEDLICDSSLKFWLRATSAASSSSSSCSSTAPARDENISYHYELCAQMNNPHQDEAIDALSVISTVASGSENSFVAYAATGSADGIVKVWRGAYEILRSIVKKETINGKPNTVGDVKKFMWKCSYSFQYRNAPVHSLTWSKDTSLLAIAHDNIISFWNPQNLSLKHSITDESRIRIRYMSIIEPRSSPKLGGGCGQAFLVVGSASVLRVYSLMSLSLLWSYPVRFIQDIAVAKDEDHIFHSTSTVAAAKGGHFLEREGWIAISTTISSSSTEGAAAVTSEKTDETDKEDTETSQHHNNQVHEILFFNPLSEKPIHRQIVHTKVVSIAFQQHTLVALTVDSEIFHLATSAYFTEKKSKDNSKQNNAVAFVKEAKLPVVIHHKVVDDSDISDFLPSANKANQKNQVQSSHLATVSNKLANKVRQMLSSLYQL